METDALLSSPAQPTTSIDPERRNILLSYVSKIREHEEQGKKVRALQQQIKENNVELTRTEDGMTAIQSVGQVTGELLEQLGPEKYIVKSSNGTRYVVGVKPRIDRTKLTPGIRVALDGTTLTIMRKLPREVDPIVFNMLKDDSMQTVGYQDVGGLTKQLREIREVIELPLTHPELFNSVGIKTPKGVLLYGPPGTGKTLLAKALACNMSCNFLKVVASAVVDKYIGESPRIVREMFGYARDNQPCIIFMDEIDAIGSKRLNQGTSADREIQRTLMEILNQLDGFQELTQVKIIMATNRPDSLDTALLRPGRLDRKVEIPLPNDAARMEILKIHGDKLTKKGTIDYDFLVQLADGFNGADIRNVCTEAGMYAIREERDYVVQDDFVKAVRKIAEHKSLEGTFEETTTFKESLQ